MIAGGNSFEVKKPDGRFLEFVLGKLGFNKAADTAIMVGDHANDVNAARAAGIKAIAVAMEVDDTRARSLGADAVVTAYLNLPRVIASYH